MENIAPNVLFMFKLTVVFSDGTTQDHLIDFIYSDRWNRKVLLTQIEMLYPNAVKFVLFDGKTDIEWFNGMVDSALVQMGYDPNGE